MSSYYSLSHSLANTRFLHGDRIFVLGPVTTLAGSRFFAWRIGGFLAWSIRISLRIVLILPLGINGRVDGQSLINAVRTGRTPRPQAPSR
jgi:hypothetical protein